MKIVQISWVDAETFGDTGWQDLEEANKKSKEASPLMKTIGFVLYECESHIALTDSIGEKECGHVTKIPKQMVQNIVALAATKRRK
jgi:hypothetical protein|tara:strand:+ start:819 stop:1076 length:258 start_codon:yes stop_codon:yes gene_type:complete